jgi:catechol 2,3-dioxygenase
MHVQRLGHVVLKVRDVRRAEAFYTGVLGIPIISRVVQPVCMTMFTLGDHHDFAVIELGDEATSPAAQATGLAHVAFKIGDSIDEFRSAKTELEATEVEIIYEADRAFTKSMHVHDPDGNEVELYIDTSDAWKNDTHAVASANSSI